MRTLLVVVLFALVGSLARADTSSTSETKDLKTYGNCHTVTIIDLFTDREDYGVLCRESNLFDETIISILSKRKEFSSPGGTRSSNRDLYVIVGKGVQFTLEDQVPIMIRVDKGETIRRSAYWDSKNPTRAFIQDDNLARRLLHDLARGQRAIIQVGDEGGNIRLNGSRRAIQDFLQRAGLQPQQSLEIPARQF